jgi:hypothetical protein
VLEIVFVLAPRQNLFFVELVNALQQELAATGIDSSITIGALPELGPDQVGVLVPPHEYFALMPGEKPDPRILGGFVFITAEQPGSSHFFDDMRLASMAGAVLDINAKAIKEYKLFGIEAELLRVGYHADWDCFGSTQVLLRAERDLDVVFMGCVTPRRARILASYAEEFDDLRTSIILSDNSSSNFRNSESFLGGGDKRRLLRRAKVLLDIHQYEEPYFEWMRAVDAIHAGCVLLSEHSIDYSPLVPGEHLIMGSREDLGELARLLVDKTELREKIAREAYEFLKSSLPFEQGAQQLVRASERVRARKRRRASLAKGGPSLAQGDGSLAQGGSSLAKGDASKSIVLPAIDIEEYSELSTGFEKEHTSADKVRPMSSDINVPYRHKVLRAALKDMRLELLDTNRAIAAMGIRIKNLEEAMFGRFGRGGEETATSLMGNHLTREVEITLISPGWFNCLDSQITVIVPVYNQAKQLVNALRSVARSKFDYGEIELVVVDDCSTDGAQDVLNQFAKEWPNFPLCVIRHNVNRGLPRSRNEAIAVARSPFVFPLDADNEILPHGLSKLYAALQGDDRACFAYGILACVGPEGPTRLLSNFPWEPERLVPQNYIDAMSLMSRAVLLEMGGYTTNRQLHGWEDYDLYSRLVEAGKRGVFVAEMVALYWDSAFSMRSLTDLSQHGAFAALKEGAPTVMARLQI